MTTTKKNSKSVPQETLGELALGDVQKLPVDRCGRHPRNRKPKPADVGDRAKSIKKYGQLDPIIVRQLGDKFQILSGETRWRAIKKLKGKTIDARVAYDVTDAQALQLVAAANGSRTELDAMQRAELLQHLTTPVDKGGAGLTQDKAGESVSVNGKPMSRAAVSNTIRLLKLPNSVRELVTTGRLPETFAREVVGWFDGAPDDAREIMAQACIEAVPKDPDDLPPRSDWLMDAQWQVERRTCSLDFNNSPYEWHVEHSPTADHIGCLFEPTPEQSKELGAFKFGDETRGTNKKLWTKLQKAAAKEWLKNKGANKSKSKTSKKPSELTPAERKAKEKEANAKFKKRLDEWKVLWRRYWLSAEISQLTRCSVIVWRFLIYINQERSSHANDAMGRIAKSFDVQLPRDRWQHWKRLATFLRDDELEGEGAAEDQAIAWASEMLWAADEEHRFEISADVVNSLATQFGFDPVEAWTWLLEQNNETAEELLRKFYGLHTVAQLSDLAVHVGAGDDSNVRNAKTKSDYVDALTDFLAEFPKELK